MRRLVIACFLVNTAAASSVHSQAASQAELVVGIRQLDSTGAMDAFVGLQRTEIYLDAPTAGVPARPDVAGATIAASSFRVRAWREGTLTARVVVYAVMYDPRAPMRETETAIATHLIPVMPVGRSVVVSQTQEWGAKPVVVNVAYRPVTR